METETDLDVVGNRNAIITFILNSCPLKLPIKATEIMEILEKNAKLYKKCFPLARLALREAYGIIMQEVPHSKTGKKFICYSEVCAKSSAEYNEEQRRDLALLFLILSYILMKGCPVYGSKLEEFLQGLKIYYNEEHPYFGDNIKKLITETFVKQLYLEQEKSESEFDTEVRYMYSWGFRSEVEFSKKRVLEAAANVFSKMSQSTAVSKPGAVLKWISITVIIVMLSLEGLECGQHKGRKTAAERSSGSKGYKFLNNGDVYCFNGRRGNGGNHRNGLRRGNGQCNKQNLTEEENNVSLWINEQQLVMLSALFFPQASAHGRIYAIDNGHVLNDVRDAHIYKHLTIPSEVNYVNFTWRSGRRKFFYHFEPLQTLDNSILKAPTVSIKTRGRIPCAEKDFSVFLPCTGNNSGTAGFNVGLAIVNCNNEPLPGTPLRFSFKKECAHRGVYDSLDAYASYNPTTLTSSQGPDPDCSLKCGNNGFCNHKKICQCNAGYTGRYCQTAFCFPQCLNNGNCTKPSVCTCPEGYQGLQCEGGICKENCLNGGKCVQKDECQCPKGYYGKRCEISRCMIPCQNGGRCVGNNKCRCPSGLGGNHCEIGRKQRSTCKRPCKHGLCMPNKTCKCDAGFYGRVCNGKIKKSRQQRT